MGSDKGLKELDGEPLIRHVIKRVEDIAEEVLVVLNSEKQKQMYGMALGGEVQLLVDFSEVGSPLVGALTGFRCCRGLYALVTSCDSPFISPDAVSMLFDEADGHDGATFQWPNGWVESLLAVYRVEPSMAMAEKLFREGELRLRRVLTGLPGVKMLPIDMLRTLDPKLLTLYDVDTEQALREAESILNELKKVKTV